MLKLIIFIASLILIGFLIVHDNWMITLSGFGYEITISTVLLGALVILLFYGIHLVKKPFMWLSGVRSKMTVNHYAKREAYLARVLHAVLANDTDNIQSLMKQKKSLFSKQDKKHLLVEGLIAPHTDIFEEMSKNPETELAGLRGLYLEAQKKGDVKEQEKILQKAVENYPYVHWVIQAQFDLQILQNDWEEALKTLEVLKKHQLIAKDAYTKGKAGLLFKTGHYAEAYALDKTNPQFAILAAQVNPKKAADILLDSWRVTPAKEVYTAYMDLFKNETALKQMKAVKKLISSNPTSKQALLALADTAIRLELWQEAKETLQVYMASYPLTKEVAELMATVIREGWHHPEEAREWEQKVTESEDNSGWLCGKCGQKTYEWQVTCPHCQTFDSILYR
ncbi:MAG: tetratricopeptide repeat protein [Alphaproteobacteria bacterium]|nr:tetratricopeptide repeat protein [Alphaproteobacteria bacterium]